jgi:hypothetical protein
MNASRRRAGKSLRHAALIRATVKTGRRHLGPMVTITSQFVGGFARLLVPLLVAMTLAGCADSAAPASDGAADPNAIQDEAPDRPDRTVDGAGESDPRESTPTQEVYRFSGLVTGADAPNLSGPGPAIEGMEPAKRDTFEAPNRTVGLVFDTEWPDGTGAMRIEVMGPDGEAVYNSHTWQQVGWGGTGAGSVTMNEWSARGLGAGTYTVLYYVAGALDVSFTVTASIGST